MTLKTINNLLEYFILFKKLAKVDNFLILKTTINRKK
jgi:hypothetical protein